MLAGCSLMPGRTAPAPAEPASAQSLDSMPATDVASLAAGLVTASEQAMAERLGRLRGVPQRSALQEAELGLLLTRPGHGGFDPVSGLAALERALADSAELSRTDIQVIAAQMDLTHAWMRHHAGLEQRLERAERARADLERKIQALTEIERDE